jgi:hypothetical protein
MFHSFARRITTDSRQDTAPVSFIDDTWKANEAGTSFDRIQKSRYWFVWRKQGDTGTTPTLYYQTQRLTVALDVAGTPSDIGLDSSSLPIVTVTDVTGGAVLYTETGTANSPVDVDWQRGRLYFPMLWHAPSGGSPSIPMEGRLIRVDWTDSSGTAHTTTANIRWMDEARVNNVKTLPSGGESIQSSTSESAVTIQGSQLNEGTPFAFLDPLAYANARQNFNLYTGQPTSPASPQQPANIWLFWASARNAGSGGANPSDIYYETMNPRFSAVYP